MSGAEKVRSRNGRMPPVGTSLKSFNNRNMRWAILFAGLVVSTLLIREYSHAWDTQAGPEGMGVFFTAFGILYAIISAFVLLESLQRFDALKLVMSDEINAMQDIRDLLCYLDGDANEAVGRDIKRAMLTYVESILDKEWVRLESKRDLDDKDTTVELHAVMTETNKNQGHKPKRYGCPQVHHQQSYGCHYLSHEAICYYRRGNSPEDHMAAQLHVCCTRGRSHTDANR